MVTATLLLALHPDGPMGHDRLESAMFWVGALFAFTPILVGLGILGVVWWHRRKAGMAGDAASRAGPPAADPEAP